MVEDKIVLNVQETASILRISVSQTYKMIQNGEIPSLRMGRRILIPIKKLEELIDL